MKYIPCMARTSRPGCLLLHGFTGAPFEMEPLAGALRKRGFALSLPLLAGHGGSVEELDRAGWEDWTGTALRAFDELAARCSPVFAAGLSMGGSLCLELALRRPVAGLACLATPLRLYRLAPWTGKDPLLPFVPLLRRFRPIWPVARKSEESRRIAPWQGCEGAMPLNALHSLMQGLAGLRPRLGQITAPLLAVHCPTDRSVNARNAFELARRVGSRIKRLGFLEICETVTGHHLLTTHQETRGPLAALVADFFCTLLSRDGAVPV